MLMTEAPVAKVVLANQKVTARKDHWCAFCGGIIPKGTDYRRVTYKRERLNDKSLRCDKVHLKHFE